jgi:hypothetical protein
VGFALSLCFAVIETETLNTTKVSTTKDLNIELEYEVERCSQKLCARDGILMWWSGGGGGTNVDWLYLATRETIP